MRTLLLFLALLLGTALEVIAKDIANKDTINGWYFLRATGNEMDTAYTRLTTKSYEGTSAQIFGNSTKNNQDTSEYRKNLNTSYPFPKFVLAKVALDSIGLDSLSGGHIEFLVGNKKNPNATYLISGGGAGGYFLSHPEWFSRPYWFDAGIRIFSPIPKPDSVDFLVVRIIYAWDNQDPKCEWIVDNIEFAYGKGNPWEDLTIDSRIIIDRCGDGEQGTGIEEELSVSPKTFRLEQNYPNPFNPSTTISFSLPRSGFTVLKIYDLLGREIATLISKYLEAGSYSSKWDASNQPSGIYFYRFQVGQYSETRKLLLMK